MPAHPHHDTHGGSVIAIIDQPEQPFAFLNDATGIPQPVKQRDEPADVTVSDLLDAYVADLSHFCDLIPYAHRDVFDSFHRVKDAVAAHKRLSPEERAEFDRRTT